MHPFHDDELRLSSSPRATRIECSLEHSKHCFCLSVLLSTLSVRFPEDEVRHFIKTKKELEKPTTVCGTVDFAVFRCPSFFDSVAARLDA